MNLRQKLLTTFGGLALLTLVSSGVTLWTIAQWRISSEQLQGHYQRSLLLQRVRANAFRAIKEVPDAITGNDPDARQEFESFLQPVEQDFQQWSALAHNKAEQQEVQQVRQAYNVLVQNARRVFDLVDAGRITEALQFAENPLEGDNFASFQAVTEEAVASDRQNRQIINAQVQNTQQTAQVALAIAAFGAISLILLLAAYLASDLFAPLREVEYALNDVSRGDFQRRLEIERDDELGTISHAFNRMVEAVQKRQQVVGLAAVNATDDDGVAVDWQNLPARVTLHRLVTQLRSRVTQINQNGVHDGNTQVLTEQKQAVVDQLDLLLQSVSRITEFGFPLDLNLARTDIRALLYEVLQRFQAEFVEQAISIEVDITPEVSYVVVDRLKLREALSELVRNAIAALPEQGGRIGLRTSISSDGTELEIEVADNGKGIKQSLIERSFSLAAQGKHSGVGLALTKSIIEQHGGEIAITGEPGQGTYVQIRLPLRE
ncbi:HAMP domain-containing sensor histidine kinase [Chroococcidiopsis sp. TS-821]|uniref:sensor histidine kinase n=1 Tax=Chroococcidiopsis sp. TS-821 TaxID=1378066 RepID=UPI000CEE3C6F|nr:HAMP domain-containing sensor histidine kinase [Chroococcidiopsis sp. TS-821]PPS39626.1 histidine kinase [Chroococcidiopsis sp. TS-821]